MKNNLKFEVEGVGKVHIDIMKFLNKKKQYYLINIELQLIAGKRSTILTAFFKL